MLGPALLHRVMQYTCSDTIQCDMRILVVTPYTDLITTTTKSNFWKRACAVHTLIAVLIWRELVSSCTAFSIKVANFLTRRLESIARAHAQI